MNKKNILILIATIVVAAVVFSFAAANADACKHEHTSNWWTVLDDCHKCIIKCDDCKTTIYDDSKFDPHVFVDGVCKCGKTDPNYQPLNIDLDIEEPEEEPEEEPLILHEHNYVNTGIHKWIKVNETMHTVQDYWECDCYDGYLTEPVLEAHAFKNGVCVGCNYKCQHTITPFDDATFEYESISEEEHKVSMIKTCICGEDVVVSEFTVDHDYKDAGYYGDGNVHEHKMHCSKCDQEITIETQPCDLVNIGAIDPEPSEFEGELYQSFNFECTICHAIVSKTLDMGPAHVHDMKLELINDSEYRYACSCGEKTDIEVFEWETIFEKGNKIVYKDFATGCRKSHSHAYSSVDEDDHAIYVTEYIEQDNVGIIYLDNYDYSEPHNIVTTMDLVNFDKWYRRCSDCNYSETNTFDWQIKTVEDNKIYFVDANGGPITKIEVTSYHELNNGEEHIKFVSDYYYRDGIFIAKTLVESKIEEHTGADNCDYCGATTDHVYVFKTRVLGISYYECTDCVAHYYRYTTDEGEVLFFDSLFDAVESKLGRELRDREWIIVNHLRETRCETF